MDLSIIGNKDSPIKRNINTRTNIPVPKYLNNKERNARNAKNISTSINTSINESQDELLANQSKNDIT